MTKKIVVIVLIALSLLVILEIVALLRLKSSINRYADYWKSRPTTGEFVYVALGDSAAQSIGASKAEKGYVGLLVARIEQKTGKQVRIVNLSVSGATVQDVIDNQLPQLSEYQSDLITVEIGGNNVASGNLSTFEAEFRQLVENLPTQTFVATIPYFGGLVKKNEQAIEASSIVTRLSAEYGLRVVDLQTETRERNSIRNYSADWFHPSDKGYTIWTDAFWEKIETTIK